MWEVRLDYRLIELIGWVSSLSNKNPKLILNNRLVGMLFFGGGAAPAAYINSQARGQIGSASAGLHHGSQQCLVLNTLSEARD